MKTNDHQGLMDLYNFQKSYPQHSSSIEMKLAGHGVNFRVYIRRSLSKIAEDRGESMLNIQRSDSTGIYHHQAITNNEHMVNMNQLIIRNVYQNYSKCLAM
jgi:hypothetical protein